MHSRRLTKRGFDLERLPFSIKVLLENVLRREDGENVTRAHVEALARWNGAKDGEQEFSFMPARVLLQDFTGVPVVADLAAMRDAIRKLGGDPAKINPLQPADLVIDHSVQVDSYRTGRRRSRSMRNSSSSAIRNATSSCAGARAPSIISAWCRPTPASCIR